MRAIFAKVDRDTALLLPPDVQEWIAMENPGPYGRNTDTFWSDLAGQYWPEFKVASLEDGLRFAFEAAPRTCFEMNGKRMPFGCHAWARYDRAFWEPFLLPESSEEDSGSRGTTKLESTSARKTLEESRTRSRLV